MQSNELVEPRIKYFLAVLFDIIFIIGVVVGMLLEAKYAVIALLLYGIIVGLFTKTGRQFLKPGKKGEFDLIGPILVILLLGAVGPIVHLISSFIKFLQTPRRAQSQKVVRKPTVSNRSPVPRKPTKRRRKFTPFQWLVVILLVVTIFTLWVVMAYLLLVSGRIGFVYLR